MSISREARLHNTALTCLQCLRNLAYFTAAHEARAWAKNDFFVAIHNNFLDISVLEWCKVFGDKNGKHFWKRSITDETDQIEFRRTLLKLLSMNECQFEDYVTQMCALRDKAIAHFDNISEIYVPSTDPAKISAQALYVFLTSCRGYADAFPENLPDPFSFYDNVLSAGKSAYLPPKQIQNV